MEKPTYEELEQKVNELEKEASKREQAEEKLEQHLASLLHYSSLAIVTLDDKYRIISCNRYFENLFQFEEPEILGKNLDQLIARKEYIKDAMSYTKKTLRGEAIHGSGKRYRKDGTLIDVEFIGVPLVIEGKVVGAYGIYLDVTARKQGGEALRESRDAYQTIFETTGTAMLISEEDTTISMINKEFEKLCGYSKEEVEGKKSWIEFLVKADLERMKGYHNVRMTDPNAAPPYYEFQFIDKQGNVRDCFITLALIPGTKKTVGSLIDVTERKKAEKGLRESEVNFRELAEKSPLGVIIADGKANHLYVNKRFAEITGYSIDELIGMNGFEVLTRPKDRRKYRERMKKRMKGEPHKERYERVLLRKDGTEALTEFFITKTKWKGEMCPLAIVQDITSRKHAEEALKESEEKYRTILESIEDGYFEVDIKGNFTLLNDSLCKIYGYSKDELMGMSNREYMDEENARRVYQDFNRVYTKGEPAKGFEWEIIRKNGTKRSVEGSVSLITDAEGQRIGFRSIARDVTEKKQMEAELNQTKDFLQNILDSSIDGITTADLQGNVIYTSPRVKNVGYEQEEIIGKKVYSLYANGIEDAKTIMKELEEKGELSDHEMKLIKKDGTLIDINLSASLLKNEKGEVIGTLGIYRDVTEKKNLQAQLLQAQKMEALGTLAGGIAHNFNNLLMSIQGNASLMLLDTNSDHPRYEKLTNIEKLVQSGSKLTSQLLGYARGGRYEVKPISMNQLIKEISATFSMTKKDITIHQELAEDLSGVKVDQGQIEQVLLNIYVNAAEAMPAGGDLFLKTMNVTHKDLAGRSYKIKPGNYVLVTVKDTGVGMDKKTMDRIFDPFFTTKGLAKGTGLGLASVYGIIKAHGGYIDVESKKAQGTTFSIYLPASEEKEVIKKEKLPEEVLRGKETVLLVDDEEMILDVGRQMLNSLGYQILVARSGKEAIELYQANKDTIDMVILDMIMPVIGGGETYDRMKEINSDIKILLSSGYSINGQATEILKRGCDGFIQKPFTMKELSTAIRDVLGN